MKKTSHPVITGIITAVILLAAFVSCGNLNSGKNSSIIVQLNAARSSLQYQKSDVSYYIVTISPDPNDEGEVRFDRTKTSHAFEGLPSGKYTITVKAYNESSILVAEGSDEDIEVIPGETATAVVEMEVKTYHVHDFATEWTTDAAYHWHAATCGDTDEIHDKAEHTFGEWITVTPATEENEGQKKRTCTVCNYEETETIPLLNHTHTWATGWTYDENNHWHECTSSNCSEKDQFAAHTWDAGVVTTQPTCTTEGVKTYTCTVCNAPKTEVIPARGHNPDTNTVTINTEPTCFTDGEREYICEYCGNTITEPIPALGWCETPIDAETFMPATKSSKLILFGAFPQTVLLKADETKITEETIEKNGVTYYIDSDGEYYVKSDVTPGNTGYRFSDNSSVSSGTSRYFKVEPIEWNVLKTDFDIDGTKGTETAVLLSSNGILIGGGDAVWNDVTHSKTGNPGYFYEDSQARAYLNGISYDTGSAENDDKWTDKGFLQQAFSKTAQGKIRKTSVDNSKNVAQPGNPTEDYIFIFSYSEWSQYKSKINNIPSDFAKKNGLILSTDLKKASWWLRSSNTGSIYYYVANTGETQQAGSSLQTLGYIPALCIDLPDAN